MPGEIEFYYNEAHPPHGISHLAECFLDFSVKGATGEPIPHEVFPDGCVSLLYRRNERLGINLLLLKGLGLETFYTEVFAGDVHWGVRFAPAACARILRCRPEDVRTQPVLNQRIVPHLTDGLLDKLRGCSNFDEAVEVYARRLSSLAIGPRDIDQKVAEAVGMIEEVSGEIKIAEIAASLNLSTRQVARRFRTSSGLTPKQFLRGHRLRATSINILKEKNLNWANRAADMGFADQSHLNREFSALTGRTPRSFAEVVGKVECGDFVD